ncbi:hypothetical protein AURDEDRAFT_182834 [Auricularia subglabra TFB-10046 SS5]|nr:hypothetical protein AURDEDRAFT_182834 [Auricularia subglabra TFB-10046 SS5]
MLPPELLLQIFAYLEWPYDLHAVSLTSRTFAECAYTALAQTLPVPFVTEDQDRLVPWLEMLLREDSGHLRAAVTRVVLDDVVKPLEPTLPTRDAFDAVPSNRYVDNELPNRSAPRPHKIHYLLQVLLPQLPNISAVFLRRHVSWFLLDAPPPAPVKTSPKRRWSALNKIVSFRNRNGSPEHEEEEEGERSLQEGQLPDLWTLLLGNKERLREMFICCFSAAKVPEPGLVRALTTLNLYDLDCRVAARWNGQDATPWTPLLAACSDTLQNLCLVRVLGFAALIGHGPPPPTDPSLPPPPPPEHITFPVLRNLEMYKVALRSLDSAALADFLVRHSLSLRTIAIGLRCDLGSATNPAAHLISTTWLNDPNLLPNLEVLRLENPEFIRQWTELPPATGSPLPGAEEVAERKRRMAKRLAAFVLARPTIVDATFPDMLEADAVHLRGVLAQRAAAAGVTGRALLGADRLASFDAYVPAEPAGRKQFLWSAWVFYELLFKDLVLARSGFRPYPPPNLDADGGINGSRKGTNLTEVMVKYSSPRVRTTRRFR